jgi:hypothetical protein
MAALRVILAAKESIRTGGTPVCVERSDDSGVGGLARGTKARA